MSRTKELSVILVLVLHNYVVSANLPPVFEKDMSDFFLPENTPVGTVVYTLKGYDPENSTVTYGLTGTDRFIVNPSTGEVTLAEPLDHEVNESITFQVSIEDVVGDVNNNVVVVTVVALVLDENDNPPKFKNSMYEVEVAEDDPNGTTVLKDIIVEDADGSGDNLEIFCVSSDQSPEACSVFGLVTEDSSQSRLEASMILRAPVNFNTKSAYNFQLLATDGVFNSTANVIVNVIDVQDLPPVFIGSLSAVLNEDAPIGTLVLTVQAKDGDMGQPRPIYYDLIINPHDYFLLDSVTGELKTGKPLDRESLVDPSAPLNLTVRAREKVGNLILDGNLTTSYASVMITLQDINDEPPRFNKKEYNIQIPENLPIGSLLPNLEMTVMDTDSGENSAFSLSLSDVSGAFTVEPQQATGSTQVNLRLANITLDYENPNQRKFIIIIKAEELYTNPRLSSTATVAVTVKDINDNPPLFKQAEYSAVILEQAAPETHVITITATDKDHGMYGTESIVYQLSGEGAELFNVDNRTGVITVTFCPTPGVPPCLDAETKPEFFLTFKATDQNGEGLNTTVSLKISLYDANDNAPIFPNPILISYIDEGSMQFEPMLRVEAIDADKTSVITYTLLDGPKSDLFWIDSFTGKIEIAGGKSLNLTQAETDHITLTVLASDGVFNTTCTVEIVVRDVNNHAPVFDQEYYNTSISEDAPIGTDVIHVTATDLDSGANAEVKYSIQKGAFEDFGIEKDTGAIKIASKLDFDRRNHYQMQILAVDQGIPSHTGTTFLTVTVLNANDKAPYFTPQSQKAEVSSDAEVGTVIHQLSAVDPDVVSLDDLRFEIGREPITAIDKTGKQITDTFVVKQWFFVERDGRVRVARPLDRSVAAIVSMPISVQDTSAPGLQVGHGFLILTIVDVNTSPPSFRQSHFVERMDEGLPKETILSTFHATDPESAISHYAIDPPNNYFHVENTTGVVRSSQQIDYERVHQINFTLVAYDTGVPQLSTSALVTVNIVNVNDEMPVFDDLMYTTSLEENSPAGTFVLKVHADDKDEGVFGEVRYSLSGEQARLFTIDTETGDIRVASGAVIDREVIEDVWLQITAVDNAPLNAKKNSTVSLHIKILDQNDNPPVFNQRVYNASVPENLSLIPPTSILQVRAEDKDASLNGQIKYTLQDDTDLGMFILDPDSGILYPSQPLIGNQTYRLKVVATDRAGAGPFFDTALIEIIVYSVNQHTPVWVVPDGSQTSFEIPESAAQPDYHVVTLSAVDEDPGDNGRIMYYIKVGNKNVHETNEFYLNETTGELRTKVYLDRETKDSYQLVLVASDQGTPQKFEAITLVTIVLSDSNDNKPQFTEETYKFVVSENKPVGIIIGSVKAHDKDAGDNGKIFYHIIDGNTNGAFFIDRIMGLVRTNRTFDREEESEFTLTIVASNEPVYNSKVDSHAAMERSMDDDMDSTTLRMEPDRSKAIVHVTILDENDNAPKFEKTTYFAGVEFTSPLDQLVTSVKADDPDYGANGTIAYMIKACNLYKFGSQRSSGSIFPSPFNISEDGSLYTADHMSNYNQDRFILNIVAGEKQSPFRDAKADIYIWVVTMDQLTRLVFDRPCSEIKNQMNSVVSKFSESSNSIVVMGSIRRYLQHQNNDWCEVHMHMVDPMTWEVMPVYRVIDILDHLENLKLEHGIQFFGGASDIIESPTSPEEKFDPAVAGLIALLILLFAGIVAFVIIRTCLRQSSHMSSDSGGGEKGSVRSRSRRLLAELSSTENPLWAEHKLRLYEEQELTMNVFGENNEAMQDLPPIDNTYATIQGGGDRDYATLNSPRQNGSQCMPQDSASALEAMLGFQGSTFQPDLPATPEPPPRSSHFQGQ